MGRPFGFRGFSTSFFLSCRQERSVVMPAGTARAEDPLGQAAFLIKLAEGVPAASIHR